MDDKEVIVTGFRVVSGLSIFWIVAINQAKKPSVALCLFGEIHTSEKAHTSLLCLAVAKVRRNLLYASYQLLNIASSVQRVVS
jgi:hypothetical protein